MTYTSQLTGLVYPDDPDLVSSIPLTNRSFDKLLSGMVTTTVTSIDERNGRFGNLGANDYRRVLIPSQDEIHEWDGDQWVIWDTKPKLVPRSDKFPLWYSSSDNDPLNIKSGELWFKYQRLGRMFKWSFYLKRAGDSNIGGGYYSFWSPVPCADWWADSGSAFVRYNNGASEVSASTVWKDSTHIVVLVPGGGRLGTSTYSWGSGDQIAGSGMSPTGGYI